MPDLDHVLAGEDVGPADLGRAHVAATTETPHLRPALHFTPRDTWMNDPNGLITHRGRHHMFFQNNPHDRVWGNLSWGHSVSDDLLGWQELPVAIIGDEHEGIFSGSVVWDEHNTSGLVTDGEGPLVALYTSAYEGHPVHGTQQAQSLAWSEDEGMTWHKHPDNPVLSRGSRSFRDPKVFWYPPTRRWVMVAVEAAHRQLVIHTSADLVGWTLASTFGPAGAPEGIWECPDLVEVPCEGEARSRWVLLMSIGSHGPAGGSGMQWFLGDFDGYTFVAENPEQVRWFDHGPDQYAAVSFSGVDGPPRVMGWMSNWVYAGESPTRPWASAMSLVRELTLDGDELRQTPLLPPTVPAELDTNGLARGFGAWQLRGVLPAEECLITLSRSGPDLRTSLSVHRVEDTLIIDRAEGSIVPVHEGHESFRIPLPEGPVEFRLVEDHGLVEIFLADGLLTACVQTFPSDAPLKVEAVGVQVALEGLSQGTRVGG